MFPTPAIVDLLFLCCPAAICFLIVAIIVDSVKRMFCGWLTPHIGQKVFIAQPTTTNKNAAPTIMFPSVCIWIAAAIQHRGPSLIFWSSRFRRRFSVRPVVSKFSQASATISGPFLREQKGTHNNDSIPAIASAFPTSMIGTGISSTRQDKEFSESFLCQINQLRHNANIPVATVGVKCH